MDKVKMYPECLNDDEKDISYVRNIVNPLNWEHDKYFVDYGGSPRERSASTYHGIKIPVKAGCHYSSNGYINPNFSFFDANYSELERTKLTTYGCTTPGITSAYAGISNFVAPVDGYLTIVTNDTNYNNLSIIESSNQPVCYTSYGEPYGLFISELPIKLTRDIYVNPNGLKDFSTLKGALDYVNSHGNIQFTVYVEKGTYNLIEEFGDDYFTNLGPIGRSGLILNNNVHLIFSSDSKVVCHYTGNNDNVKKYFSPFNTDAGTQRGFILENLTLECSNVRYCMHDETNGQAQFYKNEYKNCNMQIDNSTNVQGFPVCIGGGLGADSEIIIKDCIFKSIHGDNSTDIVSYHNCSGDGKSTIVISGCYFYDKDTVRCSWYGTTTKISKMIVSNCSLGAEPITRAESSSYNTVNVEILAFNNDIRS